MGSEMCIRDSSVVVVVLLYEFVILPVFSKCLPRVSIVNTFLFGTTVTFMWILSLLITETVVYQKRLYLGECVFTEEIKVNINYKWLIIPEFMHGFSTFLLIVSAFEFIWSQAPSTMKGMVLGFGYSLLGLSVLLAYSYSFSICI